MLLPKIKMTLACFGTTKTGKTTTIAALTNIPEKIIELSLGDSGRTKTVVEYHLVTEELLQPVVENIECYVEDMMGSAYGNPEKYLRNLDIYAESLKNFFGLEEIMVGEDIKEHIKQKIEKLQERCSDFQVLKQLISVEANAVFVRRITIRVSANPFISAFLQEKNVDLYLRDTRGLLDMALTNVEEQSKRASSANLHDLGMENLNGILLFCSNDYPAILREIYQPTFKAVFGSIPVFMLRRDENMYDVYEEYCEDENVENALTLDSVREFIQEIENDKISLYKHKKVSKRFLRTMQLLSQFGITLIDEEQEKASFKYAYFVERKMQVLLPECDCLTTLEVFKNSKIGLLEEDSFRFYQLVCTVNCCNMMRLILQFREEVLQMLSSGLAGEKLKKVSNQNVDNLEVLFKQFDVTSGFTCGPFYWMIRELKKTSEEINYLLMDPEVELLGPYGGITTMNNRKFRYPATVLAAVLSYLWIEECIENIQLKEELEKPDSDEPLFVGYKGNLKQQEALLKVCLRNALYFSEDAEATINSLPIINRWSVTNAIEQLRIEQKTEYPPMVEVVQNIVEDFCITTEQYAGELYEEIS